MNKVLCIALLIVYNMQAYAMMNKLKLRHARSYDCKRKPSVKTESGIFHKSFPPEVDQYVIERVATNSGGIDLINTAKGINSLARTNKFLNWYMNDDKKALYWIKQLSQQFGISNEFVAQKLCFFAAVKCLALHNAASDVISLDFDYASRQIAGLCLIGLDLNFTYHTDSSTLIMDAIEDKRLDLVDLFVQKGVDINICKSDGKNLAMEAYLYCASNIFSFLLNRSELNINYQDNFGNTLLHYCIKEIYRRSWNSIRMRLDYVYQPVFFEVGELLTKGANPTIKNKDGKTSLELALCMEDPGNKGSFLKIEYPQIIELLLQAEFDWNESLQG